MSNKYDLNNVPDGHQISLEPIEHPHERGVRLTKDLLLFVVALAAVCVFGWICVDSLLFSPNSSPDEKKWAMSVLSAMISGLVGYLMRK